MDPLLQQRKTDDEEMFSWLLGLMERNGHHAPTFLRASAITLNWYEMGFEFVKNLSADRTPTYILQPVTTPLTRNEGN